MKNTQNRIIIILCVIVILILLMCMLVEARYQTIVEGKGNATIANWSFKLIDNDTSTTDIIELAVTRTDLNTKVVENKIAPGTYGEFEIGIDARGTETVVEYTIELELANIPKNLKFYIDEERTKGFEVVDNKIKKIGYMTLEEVNEIRIEKIYWEWPYETGEDILEIEENDKVDTEYAGQNVCMPITVTGIQVLDRTILGEKLADVVEVGDYVNYDANSRGTYTFTRAECPEKCSVSETISTQNDFNSNAPAQWRVLRVDKEAGVVELISVEPTTQTIGISQQNGFINAETLLNNIGSIYGNGYGAVNGRSIKLEDVEQYSSYDPYTYKNVNTTTGYYGGTRNYTVGDHYKDIKLNGEVIGYETTTTLATSDKPVTMTQISYEYVAQEYFANTIIYNMLFKNSVNTQQNKPVYWLASRSAHLYSVYSSMRVRCINEGSVAHITLCRSDGTVYSPSYTFVPVVTLQTNITTTGQDENGVWELEI